MNRLGPLDENERHDIPADLDAAIAEFIEAGRKYREFLKRHHPERLMGVVYAENEDGEMVLYSESSRFNGPIKATNIPL